MRAMSLAKAHGRGLLLSVLEKECVLTGIKVLQNGSFLTETEDWDSYWKLVSELDDSEVNEKLHELHAAWRDYILSGFDSALRQEFCFGYFVLLDSVLSNFPAAVANNSRCRALQVTLGFECFGITSASSSEVSAAGTSTLRNPCYLLAKLKMPDALDDPQFLPLITVAGARKPELFYYYRQYNLAADSPMVLMFYPAVSEANRPKSFRLIKTLAGSVGYSVDPRTRERAQRLCRGIVGPLMEANKLIEPGASYVEFVDVGAGSGSLVSAVCREIRQTAAPMRSRLRFQLWFVDLETSDPARFFRAKNLRGLVDSPMYLGSDYRAWLSEPEPLPKANGIRIAFVSRLFNNLSVFNIRRLSEGECHLVMDAEPTVSRSMTCLPSACLAPGGRGPESLHISNSRVTTRDGRTFAQASLTQFCLGLFRLGTTDQGNRTMDGLFLPVRTFNPNSLLTLDGRSVISRLVDVDDYVVIEDADLRPRDLVDHMTMFSLQSSVVYDITRALGLTGNHAYVVWSKAKVNPSLAGERIW